MATGTVNSSMTLNNLRSGERAASSPAALRDPKAKVYHHMVPGAKFVMPDGLELIFLGGQYATTDAEQIAELDKIADRSTSMIYTKREVAAAVSAQADSAAAAASDTAGTVGKTS